MYIAFNMHVFVNQKLGKRLNVLTHPIKTSLYRLKQKLLWNVDQGRLSENCFFVSLTVDESHYDQVFNNPEQSGSRTLSKKITALRNRLKRAGATLDYMWRIERGYQNTKRLHVHTIMKTDFSEFYDIKAQKSELIEDWWEFADWAKMRAAQRAKNEEFDYIKPCETNGLINYLVKYIAKPNSEAGIDRKNIAQTKKDIRCRIYSTSRAFTPIPKWFQMKYDWENFVWKKTVRENYRTDHKGGYICYAPYERLRSETVEVQVQQKSKKRVYRMAKLMVDRFFADVENEEEKRDLHEKGKNLVDNFQTDAPYFKKRRQIAELNVPEIQLDTWHARHAQKAMGFWEQIQYSEFEAHLLAELLQFAEFEPIPPKSVFGTTYVDGFKALMENNRIKGILRGRNGPLRSKCYVDMTIKVGPFLAV